MGKTALISIVDDNDSAREGIMDLIKSMGFEAEAFERAEDFLRSSRHADTSCLITDVQMPGMTGLELHARLLASGKPIPTIVITAFPEEADRARALKAGIVCYLPKPFDEDHLLACIRTALVSFRTREEES